MLRARVQPKQNNPRVDDLRKQHEHIARSVGTMPFKEGKRLSLTIGAAGNTTITHGLHRRPTGWIVVDATGAANDVYRTAWDAESMTLAHPGAGTLALSIMVI